MLLNDIGQPIVLRTENHSNLPLIVAKELKYAPILLNDFDMIKYSTIPTGWCGILYTSKKIYDQIDKQFNQPVVPICILEENVPKKFTLGDEECQITMVSLTDNEVVFIIKDNYTTNLHTNSLSNSLNAFLYNSVLREAIVTGIDILYINDTIFHENCAAALVQNHPNQDKLRKLVYLVKPKKVVGVTGAKLPDYILELCEPKNIYCE